MNVSLRRHTLYYSAEYTTGMPSVLLLRALLLLMLQPALPLTARKQQHQHQRKQVRQP